MSEHTGASYEMIKAACVGADSEFICDQLERKNTVDQAREDWMTEQQLRLEEREKELQAALQREVDSKQQATATASATGVDPLEEESASSSDSAGSGGDALSEWRERVQKKVDAGMSRQRASSAVNRENPGLRERVVMEANANRRIA